MRQGGLFTVAQPEFLLRKIGLCVYMITSLLLPWSPSNIHELHRSHHDQYGFPFGRARFRPPYLTPCDGGTGCSPALGVRPLFLIHRLTPA